MSERAIKECKSHGSTEFYSFDYKNKKKRQWKCTRCNVEAVQKRRTKVKKMAVEYGGGSCRLCGYDKCNNVLTFHHLDPNEKDFGISAKGYTRSWEKVKTELDKCVLLCNNCHGEVHAGMHPEYL